MSERNPDLPEEPELDSEMTIIIDESDFEDGIPTIVVEPDMEEEVLVVLPDEDGAELEDVPLLSQHPDVDDSEVTEPLPVDVYQDFLDDGPDTAEAEALPDLEHVEDITAMLQDESVQLEAPTDPHAVRYEAATTRRRMPWLSLAAAACVAAAGVFYGPELIERFGSADSNTVAQAQPKSTGKKDPVVGQGPAVVDPMVDAEIEKVAFREWVTTALSHNLGAAVAAPQSPSMDDDEDASAASTSMPVEEARSVDADSVSDQENK